MKTTPWMQIPYPEYGDTDWAPVYEASVEQVDAQSFALWEHVNTPKAGGGLVQWDGATLTWSADMVIPTPAFGRNVVVAAGELDVGEGEFVVATVVRGPTAHTTGTIEALSQVPPNVRSVVLAFRPVGSTSLYFTSGNVLAAGDIASTPDGGKDAWAAAMIPRSVPAGVTVTIPSGFEMKVSPGFTVLGDIVVLGTLTVA